MCSNFDSSTLPSRTQSISKKEETVAISHAKQHDIQGTRSSNQLTIRNRSSHRETEMSEATKLTHSEVTKSILKNGIGKYSLQRQDACEHSEETSPSLDRKFRYRLPDKPVVYVQKSVSFREDKLLHNATEKYGRRLSSPALKTRTGVAECEQFDEKLP